MRFTAIFLAALICISAVHAVSLRKSATTTNAKYAIERLRLLGKKSNMASQIVSSIELSLTNNGKVDDVIALVQEALEDVINRRTELQQEWDNIRTELETVIANADARLIDLNNELAATLQEILRLTAEINRLNAVIEGLKLDLQFLDEREAAVEAARQNDITSFERRRQRDLNAIEALNQIIPALQQLLQRGNSFLEVSKSQIERALKRIPKSNPIQALVQLSTKFNEEKLADVISKLDIIRDSIIRSQQDDQQGEEESRIRYEALIAEIHSIRSEKLTQLLQAEEDLQQALTDKSFAEGHRDGLVLSIQETTEIRNETQRTLDSQTIVYTNRIREADDAIAGVREALAILEQHRDQLQGRENEADSYNQDLYNNLQ